MKKKSLLFMMALVLTGFLTACGASSQESSDRSLVVAMELAYPPFEFKDASGAPAGISVDLVKAFGEYAGYDVKIENMAWEGLIPSLQTGQADMVLSSMTITEDRLQTVDFSAPYANSCLAILANKQSGIASVEDLNQQGKTIAVKNGSIGHFYAMKHLPQASLTVLADESACVTEVVQGKADGFLYDQLTIYRNWNTHKDTTEAIFIPFQKPEQWGAAVKKGNTALLDSFNAFLKDYQAQGGFERLTQTYMAEEKAIFDKWGFTWFFDLEE